MPFRMVQARTLKRFENLNMVWFTLVIKEFEGKSSIHAVFAYDHHRQIGQSMWAIHQNNKLALERFLS